MRNKVLGAVCFLIVGVLVAFSGAASPSFSGITLSDIVKMSLSTEPINGSDNAMNRIPTGTILVYQTDEGRYGVLEIASYDSALTLNWRTYNADGSVYGSGNGLVVHGTYTCDLDRGVEGAFSADFHWSMHTSVERYIEPENGASFAVVQPTAVIFTPVLPVQPSKPPAPVPRTGQTSCFQSTSTALGVCCMCATGSYSRCKTAPCPEGQDGHLRRGVAWPIPRFTDNDDGTVTDNLTGLIWLREANCFSTVAWGDALLQVGDLQDGMCGLGDGSAEGDWRLPNVREMQSLIRYGFDESTFFHGGTHYALPNTLGTGSYPRSLYPDGDPFNNIYFGEYWTSTSYVHEGLPIDMGFLTYGRSTSVRDPDSCTAWYVDSRNGRVFGADDSKLDSKSVWPVRNEITPRLPRTGQSLCYESESRWGTCYGLPTTCGDASVPAGQDGALQTGMAWPIPRFTDNGDGTVTDNLTGLIWLRDANCFGEWCWGEALDLANRLRSGECGLSDGSDEGDWRLPNILELQSLIHYGVIDPALPDTEGTGGRWQDGHPFVNVRSWYYWTSTTYEISYRVSTGHAWCVNLFDGHVAPGTVHTLYHRTVFDKSDRFLVWPVRSGQ